MLAAVGDNELQSGIVRLDLYIDASRRSLWIGIVHHIHHGLLDGEVHLHGGQVVEAHRFADVIDEFCQLGHLLDVVGQREAALVAHVELLLRVLDGEHGEVVTLFCAIDEFLDSRSHILHEPMRVVIVCSQGCFCHLQDTLLGELVMLDVLSLGESVGIKENGGAGIYLRFLHRELPVAHHTDRQVGVARQHADAGPDEQG